MSRRMKLALIVSTVMLDAILCLAQSANPIDSEKAAALDKIADQFIERLHQTLDVGAQAEMFVPETADRYREYPGEFLPLPIPRMAKTLLKASDDATLRRKLNADWNLAYLSSVLVKASGPTADPIKVLPPDFVKLARKSNYLKSLIGVSSQVTLVSSNELNEYLSEADQAIPMLRKGVKPGMFATAFRPVSQQTPAPSMVPYAMGYDATYVLNRESLGLVMVESGGAFKLVTLAAVSN